MIKVPQKRILRHFFNAFIIIVNSFKITVKNKPGKKPGFKFLFRKDNLCYQM